MRCSTWRASAVADFGDGPLHECSAEGWDVTLDSNVRSMFLVCRGVLRHWLDNGRPGTILNMSSVLAFSPQPQHFATHAYAASKGAIISMSLAMAAYYAPQQDPGQRDRAGAGANAHERAGADEPTETSGVYRSQAAVERRACSKPTMLPRRRCFCLAKQSRHITGQVVTVDGGWTVSG